MNLIALTVAQIEEVTRLAEIRATKGAGGAVEKPVDLAKHHIPDLEQQHLVTAIEKLSATAQSELMAFMWLGQGKIGDNLSRWGEIVQAAEEELDSDIPDQLASKVRLHEYLRRGLVMIGQVQSPKD